MSEIYIRKLYVSNKVLRFPSLETEKTPKIILADFCPFSKNRPTPSAAIQTGSLYEESVVEVLPHYDDCIELTKGNNPSGEFLLHQHSETSKL